MRAMLFALVTAAGACAEETPTEPSSTAAVMTTISSAAQLSASAQAGAYCIKVGDIGELTGPATFTVTISHP